MSPTNVNGGVPRKTLAEGLNGAVADAVRDVVVAAVRQAVEQVLREVLTSPDLLRALAAHLATAIPSPVPAAPEPPSPQTACAKARTGFACGWHRILDKAKAACRRAGAKLRTLPGKVRDRIKRSRVAEKLESVRRFGARAWELRAPVSLSLAAGVVTGVLGYAAGPAVSAVALGACGSAITLAASLAAPFLRMWKALNAQPA
jgi:hypothetical protein